MRNSTRQLRRPSRTPSAGSTTLIVVAVVAIVAILLAVAWFIWRGASAQEGEPVILTEVVRAPYEYIVLEQGEVESSSNVEIRCEVKARGGGGGSGGGTAILEVIPEGTVVKPGDVLVRLDSTALDQELLQQQITCNTSAALVTQSKNTYDTAVKAETEYLESTFPIEVKTIENEIFQANNALKTAELDLAFAQHGARLDDELGASAAAAVDVGVDDRSGLRGADGALFDLVLNFGQVGHIELVAALFGVPLGLGGDDLVLQVGEHFRLGELA